jgi:uncharacterized membrane protein YhhN
MNAPHWIAAYVFFGLFLAASAINLVCGYNEWEKPRKISKPFCLFFLTIACACAAPEWYLIYIGTFLGFLGDVFLLWKRKKSMLVIGAASFLLGDLCYIATMLLKFGNDGHLNWTVGGCMIAYLVALELILVPLMYTFTKHNKLFTVVGVYYASILITVGATALLGDYWGYAQFLVLVAAGDVFFCISDLTLGATIFRKDIKRRDFWIMLTYLLAEGLIASGLVFTVIK